eukprot:gb/GFBE01015644.1/.p1 GENE.gb/GFBE01015644.1/~~gb/GFBE01015644.1/.p1  ORF type:complete len:619 (+),score=84.95 gb/GFBE01015644.1/:1-1857(+)
MAAFTQRKINGPQLSTLLPAQPIKPMLPSSSDELDELSEVSQICLGGYSADATTKDRRSSSLDSASTVADRTERWAAPSPTKAKHGIADLGQGVLWLCCDSVKDAAFASAEHISQRSSGVSAEDVLDALIPCAEQGCGSCCSGEVCAIYPEALSELDYIRWDGDGHYNLSKFRGDHPPTLGQVISFLHMVDGYRSRTTIHASSYDRLAVGAVLAGAVLVLARGLTAEAAWARLLAAGGAPSNNPKDAWDRFPPPFSTTGETSSSSVCVLDCLAGLEMARDKGWLEDYRTFDVPSWRLLRRKLDASWLIPGEVLALANPWTTSKNPAFPGLLEPGSPRSRASSDVGSDMDHVPSNGSTPSSRIPDSPGLKRIQSPTGSLASAASSVACLEAWDFDAADTAENAEGPGVTSEAWEFQLTIEVGTRVAGTASPESHCVRQTMSPKHSLALGSGELRMLEGDSYVSYLRRKGIDIVVRLNHDFECPEQVEYEEVFKSSGLRLRKESFNDGDIPSKVIVQNFNGVCRDLNRSPDKALAVHCMGGLGRTGVVVGAYAVAHHRVSGKAFHGWTRMCRPGTVQTLRQEAFLRSLQPKSTSLRSRVSSFSDMFEKIRSRVPSFSSMS